MTIKMGPVLAFRGNPDGKQWQVSVMVVTTLLDQPPVLQLGLNTGKKTAAATQPSPQARLLSAVPTSKPAYQVWRFDISMAQTSVAQSVPYRVITDSLTATASLDNRRQATAQFSVPALGCLPNMAYVSCNGFSSAKYMNQCQDPQAMWRDLGAQHTRQPYQLLLMGGDQCYADSLWETIPALHDWAALPTKEAIRRPFTATMRQALDKFYAELYIKRWVATETAAMLASVPTLMMWDDHDIFDGWGSYEPGLQQCPVYQGIFATARAYFSLYQLQLAPGELHPCQLPHSTSFSYGALVNKLAIVALDMRSDRNDQQVLNPDNWKAVYDWLDQMPAGRVQHVLVMSSIPVVHPDFSLIEKTLSIFPGRQSLEDDLRDHWMSRPHKEERLRFIHRLFDVAQRKQCRITLLSGDVHVGALGTISNTRGGLVAPINQLTSSGIVHPAPPGALLFFMEQVMRKENQDDRGIISQMQPFPGGSHYYLGARNWLALEPDAQDRIWANWHVEGERHVFTKVIHPPKFSPSEAKSMPIS